jgi:tRNA(Arg) A34 adenosine deaminase TadA
MRTALEMAGRGLAAGGPPVGACIVCDGEVVAAAHNSVIGELDATAHAEITVIRQACRELRTLNLTGCDLYVTVQPCAMCLSACHYAGIHSITYGAALDAMQAITGNELDVDQAALFAGPIRGGVQEAECGELLQRWQSMRR